MSVGWPRFNSALRGHGGLLAADMVLGVEPEKGVPGVGMVGGENTYRVTPPAA